MTTNETSRIVRWLVIIVLGAATAGMVAVSLRANYLFGYGFGQTPEKAQVFGWANVAADLWKVAGLIVITSLWRANQKRVRAQPRCRSGYSACCGACGGDWRLRARSHRTHRRARSRCRHLQRCRTRTRQKSTRSCELSKTERSVTQVDAAIAAVLGATDHVRRAHPRHGRKAVSELHERRASNGGSLSRSCLPARRTCCGRRRRAAREPQSRHCERRSPNCAKAAAHSPPIRWPNSLPGCHAVS